MTNEQLLLAAYAKGQITKTQMEDGLMKSHGTAAHDNSPANKIVTQLRQTPTQDAGASPEGFSYKPDLNSILRPGPKDQFHQNNPNGLAGVGLGALVGGVTGGPVGAAMGAFGGATAQTPGDVAQNTLLSAAPKLLPGAGPSRIMQALKGALGGGALSAAGQQAKSVIDNGQLSNPLTPETGIAAALGGVAGATGARPANAPTPAEAEALSYQQKLKDYAAQKKTVAKLENNTTPLKERAADLDKAYRDAKVASREATNNLDKAAKQAATYDKNDNLAKQSDYVAKIHDATVAKLSAQDKLDAVARKLADHEKFMAREEARVKTEDISDTLGDATDIKNKNTVRDAFAKIGKNPDGTAMTKDQREAWVLEKAKNNVDARNLQRDAADTRSGATPLDVVHKPETLKALDNLTESHADAADEYQRAVDNVNSLKQQKFDHKVMMQSSTGGAKVDEALHRAPEEALQEMERAQQAAREARDAHLNHWDTLAEEKNKLIDMAPDDLPESATGAAGKLGAVLSAIPGTKTAGAALKGVDAVRALMSTAKVKPPEPPSILQQLLVDKLGANANTLQPVVPDLLRQLLRGQQEPTQQ